MSHRTREARQNALRLSHSTMIGLPLARMSANVASYYWILCLEILRLRLGFKPSTLVYANRELPRAIIDEDDGGRRFETEFRTKSENAIGIESETNRHREPDWDRHECCARGRPIIVEWERDARHSAGLSLVR
ncbi:hypothetical protein EVAR_23292_1 [Eumeta japonica]|uniref:Uncharacterized protein n=1 Tax=Eumeta variegata TaxID=151549 RepID=A0A4C1V877_EUMVA|nr:hypothetical protein EVAR_23292_1 [Eumeta japonica]